MPLCSQDMIKLQNWFSPSFPVGAYAYSHGLETAFAEGDLATSEQFRDWLNDLVKTGSGWNDAVFGAHAWEAGRTNEDDRLLCELCEALAPGKERHQETVRQGANFLKAQREWCSREEADDVVVKPLPIAAGALAGRLGVDKLCFLTTFLNAFVSNLIQAALRLAAFGQDDGLRLLRRLEPVVVATAERAMTATLEDLSNSTFMSDLLSMRHAHQYSRIFSS